MEPFHYLLAAFALGYGMYLYSQSKELADAKHITAMKEEGYKQQKVDMDRQVLHQGTSVETILELNRMDARKEIQLQEADGLKWIEVVGDVVKAHGLAHAEVNKAQGLSDVHVGELVAEDDATIGAAEKRDEYARRKARLDGAAQARRREEAVPGSDRSRPGRGEPPAGGGGGDDTASGRHRKR